MIRSKVLAAMMCAGLLMLFGASTANAQDACGYGGCTTTSMGSTTTSTIPTITVVRGQTIDISGNNCAPNATVVVTYDDGTTLGTFTADSTGSFVVTITIPANSTLGQHLVTATCGSVQQFVKVNVLSEQIPGTTPGVGTGTLPRTGSSNTGPLVGIGAAAMVLGAAFVYGSRRPRSA